MLESMASGAVPIAGDLESIREWIKDGQNGLLIDPANPAELAEAILQALNDPSWRQAAREHNKNLAEKRASREVVFREARSFYEQVLARGPVL
jgi:glycosyltransferase involved in cell wall biosynthesis